MKNAPGRWPLGRERRSSSFGIERRGIGLHEPTCEPSWLFIVEDYLDPARAQEVETCLMVANGRIEV